MHEPVEKNSASIYVIFPPATTRKEPKKAKPMIQKSAVGLILPVILAPQGLG